MRNKKWLSLVLAVVMLFSAIPFGAFAEKKEATVEVALDYEGDQLDYGEDYSIIATATAEGFDKNSTDHSDEFTLEYYKVVSGKDDEKLDAKPKAAGDYKVRVLLADSSTHTGEAEQKFTIERKTLTIEGLKATDRKYDESSDKVQITGTAQLVGGESGDTVTLNNTQPTEGTIQGYEDENGKTVHGSERTANGLPVIVEGLALEGKDKDNYTLDASLTVNIWSEWRPAQFRITSDADQKFVLFNLFPKGIKNSSVRIIKKEGDDLFKSINAELEDNGDTVLTYTLKENLDINKSAKISILWETQEDGFYSLTHVQPIHLTAKAFPVRFVEDMVFDYTGKPLTAEQFNLPKKFYIDDETGKALLEKADGTREVLAGKYSFIPELNQLIEAKKYRVSVRMKETEHLAEITYGIKVTIKSNVTGNSGSGSGGSSHASVRPGSKDSKDVSKPTDKTPAQTSVTPSAKAVLTIGSKSYMTKDGMKPMDVAPMLHQGRTMLPARMIAELLGVNVAYNATNKTASFEYTNGDSKNTVALTLGQKMMKVNGKDVALTADLIVVNGRILLPIRDIQKALKDLGLNIEIDWNAQTREVSIK